MEKRKSVSGVLFSSTTCEPFLFHFYCFTLWGNKKGHSEERLLGNRNNWNSVEHIWNLVVPITFALYYFLLLETNNKYICHKKTGLIFYISVLGQSESCVRRAQYWQLGHLHANLLSTNSYVTLSETLKLRPSIPQL